MPPSTSPASDDDQEALDWLVRQQRGLDAREQAQLTAWLHASPARAQALERWRRDWALLDTLPASSLARIRANLGRDQAECGHRRQATRRRALALAGSALGAAAMGVVLWRHTQQPAWQQTFASQRGQQLSLALPDGSRIQMDTQTRLQARFFRDRRDIMLFEGQADFAVAPDAGRPFRVMAGDTRATALGTQFTVRLTPAIPGQPGTGVAVSTGQVRVAARGQDGDTASPDSESAIILNPGERIASDGHGHLGRIASIAPADIASWVRQRLSFDDIPLRQAIAELERYGDTRLRLADARAGDLRITGTFNARDLSNFRLILPQVLPVRLNTGADGWTDIRMRG